MGLGLGQGVTYNGDMGGRSGITWLELIVFGLLLLAMGWGAAILLGGVGSSLNERNRQRLDDIQSLADALLLYAVEHDGRYPEGIMETGRSVCREGASSCEERLDLHGLVPRYLERIPMDPFAVGINETFYTVRRGGSTIVVAAPYAEGGEVIRVER